MKLLHIDSSILGGHSVSRKLSADVVEKFKSIFPGITITYRDLAASPIAHLSGGYLGALQSAEGQHEPALQADLLTGAAVMEEFLAADIVVVGAGLYNFTIASQLKSWVDRILVAGKTFRYTPDGQVEGLAGDKRVVLALARGGFYSEGSPSAPFEHGESLLRGIFGFIGVSKLDAIIAEGIAIGPDHRAAAIASAAEATAKLGA